MKAFDKLRGYLDAWEASAEHYKPTGDEPRTIRRLLEEDATKLESRNAAHMKEIQRLEGLLERRTKERDDFEALADQVIDSYAPGSTSYRSDLANLRRGCK